MGNIVLIGGNGYIGTEVLRQWLLVDPQSNFYIVARSNKNKIKNSRVHFIQSDFTVSNPIVNGFPDKIDHIVNFIGRPAKDQEELIKMNETLLVNMIKLADDHNTTSLGFIGGVLGPKSFTEIKSKLIENLNKTGKKISYVEPTIVYGGDRNDTLSKMVPLFRFLGIFIRTMRPVKVENVAKNLIEQLCS
jgi:nucleoside-diphosphate-sugar epimerase